MSYLWQPSPDKFGRISAWRSSKHVYLLRNDWLFFTTSTSISVRYVPEKVDLEMMLGPNFLRLNANYGTRTDNERHVTANVALLNRFGISVPQLFYANAAAVPEQERGRCQEPPVITSAKARLKTGGVVPDQSATIAVVLDYTEIRPLAVCAKPQVRLDWG